MRAKKREASPPLEELQKAACELQEHISKKLKRRQEIAAVDTGEGEYDGDSESSNAQDDEDEVMESQNKENIENNGQQTITPDETDLKQTSEFVELDEETLLILSDDESADQSKRFLFHPKLASTWQKTLSEGLKKEKKTALLEKYPKIGNCPIQTPKLNIEIEASVNDTSKKRDKFFVSDMDLCGASLSALGSAISMIFDSSVKEIDTKDLLCKLVDSGKLMCELHNQLIKARKAFIYPSIDKKVRSILEKAETGEFLFGSELSLKIKSAKAVEKLGLTIKPQTVDKKPMFQASSALNWRGPSVRGRRGGGQTGRKYFDYQKGAPPLGMQGGNRQSNHSRNPNNQQTPQNPPGTNNSRK